MIFDLRRPAILARSTSARECELRTSAHEEDVISLFDQFREPLYRYLSGFGVQGADTEEIIQETFLALFRHLKDGKSRENLPAWLFRVSHNLALKRRQQTRRDSEILLNGGGEHLMIDPGPNPEDQFASRQARQRLLTVIEALPEQDRRCLFLRAEGLRYRGIAEVLDISLGAVAISLARSLARIGRAADYYKL